MLRRVAVVVVALLAFFGGPLGRDAALAGPVQDLTAMTNADRVAKRLRALSTAEDIQRFAQQRAEEMARSGKLAHTVGLGSKISGWQRLGENVGRGPTLQEIQTAFMASPSHRENILDPGFTQIGVGVTSDGKDYLYVAVIFRLPSGSAATAAPAPTSPPTTRASAAPKPRPKPTTTTQAPTTTTQAPTTTTTAPPPPPPPPVEEVAPPVESTTTTMESTTTTAPRPITKDPEFLAANFSDRIVPAAAVSPMPAPGRATWPIVLAAVLGLLVGGGVSAALRLELRQSRAGS
ncbi:MAG TPA: CAP domain-containing protein [Acidimicrobiia bacterium]|nr:CAP domain-containing protein [Acidimicrobiia bacterium]